MDEQERERHLRDAHEAAKRAERLAKVGMWGSGCVLALYLLAGLLMLVAVGIVVWILVFG